MRQLLKFDGQLVYAGSESHISAICEMLILHAEALSSCCGSSKRRQLVLGFDMEWQYRPQELPPALVQLVVQDTAVSRMAHIAQAAETVQAAATQTSDPSLLQGSTKRRHSTPCCSSGTEQGSGPGGERPAPALEAPSPAVSYTCYLLHLARLGPDGPSRAVPALKRLLEHPQVVSWEAWFGGVGGMERALSCLQAELIRASEVGSAITCIPGIATYAAMRLVL
jgi:hypothetical protein